MAGNDREPIGRKGKPTRPVKQKVSRRRYEDDDDYDDYDDYEDHYKDEPRKDRKMKSVQIPYDLFVALVEYHLAYGCC